MNHPPQLIIFDLDGTLLDTLSSLAGAYNEALQQMNCPPHPVASYRYIIGDGARVAAERALPSARQLDADIDECVMRFKAIYKDIWQDAAPYRGIEEMLQQLQGRISLAVLSNKDSGFTRQCTDHFFPNKFALVQGFEPGIRHKPDPTGANKIISAMGVRPQQTFMVGDTATDMLTARAVGMTGIGVKWGFREAAEMIEAGANQVIESPAELAELIAM